MAIKRSAAAQSNWPLVREIELFAGDGTWSDEELVAVFTDRVPPGWRLLIVDTARPMVRALAGFARSLYDEVGVTGAARS